MKNLIKKFNKLMMVMFVLLLFNCSNENVDSSQELGFDYTIYEMLISQKHNFPSGSLRTGETTLERNRAILDSINQVYETDVYYSDSFLILTDSTAAVIDNTVVSNNWITPSADQLYGSLVIDLGEYPFKDAIKNFENAVLASSPSPEEFENYNLFVNTMKTLNFTNPEFFGGESERGWWACAYSTTVFLGASVAAGLACVPNPTTPLTCPLAVSMASLAYAKMLYDCGSAALENK